MSLVHAPGHAPGPVRRGALYLFARYLEMPLLAASYHLLRGRYRRIGAWPPVRAAGALLGAAFAYGGDTARPLPAPQALALIDDVEGAIAVGPCRCRLAHDSCDHPIETDIVIHAGVEAFTRAFPDDYRRINREEAKAIVTNCSRLGMWQMVFVHCPIGAHEHAPQHLAGLGHEYVICNCCTCGCVPYILNQEMGQRVYPLLRGDFVAITDPARCSGHGACIAACPFDARAVADGHAVLVAPCFGCGLCVSVCPEGAVEMQPRTG
jgi:NAD-dependent dihydropyrimidine dehydrogenase PreA subunit